MQRLRRWLKFNWMYFRRPPWDTGISPPELKEFMEQHSAGRALDVGCGTGTNLLTLAQAGWQVVGMDFALRAVNKARRRLSAAGYAPDVFLGDVSRLQGIDGPFDLVLDIGCYHGLPSPSRAAYRQNLLRVLALNGRYLLYVHQTSDEQEMIGFRPSDMRQFEQDLICLKREDSLDNRGRSAAWMTFARKGTVA